MHVDTALAYSCNGFVAHAAERFAPGELGRELHRFGFASRTGLASDESSGLLENLNDRDSQKMQALGEAGVLVTPLEMEVLEEPGSGRVRVRVRVRDAETRESLAKVQVKVIGSDNSGFLSGETDLRGVSVAEGVLGQVTAVAKKGAAQYAFYRGTSYVGSAPTPGRSAQLFGVPSDFPRYTRMTASLEFPSAAASGMAVASMGSGSASAGIAARPSTVSTQETRPAVLLVLTFAPLQG